MFSLPKLPYSYNALEPYIDEATMRIHYSKHHAAYVDNLNKTLETNFRANKKLQKLSVEKLLINVKSIPENIRQTVVNNAGGHANHSFFWQIMSSENTQPQGKLLLAIESEFGSLDRFKEAFSQKAMSVFGSGWAFLTVTKEGKLKLKRHSFQNSPLMQGNIPILGIDVWEHAYYLKYQNRRTDYIQAWWNVVNWPQVSKNYEKNI